MNEHNEKIASAFFSLCVAIYDASHGSKYTGSTDADRLAYLASLAEKLQHDVLNA